MNPRFDWKRYPEAEAYLLEVIGAFLGAHQWASRLEKKIKELTSTKFIDWVDHLVLPDSISTRARLAELGFVHDPLAESPPNRLSLWHPEAVFPNLVLQEGKSSRPILELALKVDSVTGFKAAFGIGQLVQGAPKSRYRELLISEEEGLKFLAVERRAYRGYIHETPSPEYYREYARAEEILQTRPRHYEDTAEGFKRTGAILQDISARIGRDLTAHLFFEQERKYWQERNKAGQIQKGRQDSLGLGWANHDHHTFRCSRKHLADLVRTLEDLGFHCREQFYAGQEAGWGAQVMENHLLSLSVFADLDLSPEEVAGSSPSEDFAHQPLPLKKQLGTVGLWVALHGESFFQAGMHHMAVRSDFDPLRSDLAREGIPTMTPFSDFPFLRQAFTQGEQWKVRPNLPQQLLSSGSINQEQFQKFSTQGAIGSHLENIERREGFKGFNQRSVSAIIQATDPRAYTSSA